MCKNNCGHTVFRHLLLSEVLIARFEIETVVLCWVGVEFLCNYCMLPLKCTVLIFYSPKSTKFILVL